MGAHLIISNHVFKNSLIYIGKLSIEKDRGRLRPSPIPTEASRRFTVNGDDRTVIVTIRKTRRIVLPVPWHIIAFLKELVFKKRARKEDVREEVGMIVYEYLNPILRLLGLGNVVVLYRVPRSFKYCVKKETNPITHRVEEIKAYISASGFTIYPGNQLTDHIKFYAKLYNISNDEDYGNWSRAAVVVDIYGVMKQLGIRWDTSL